MLCTKVRILLIDDDEVDFVITSKLLDQLESSDYDLDWVDSYEEGLRVLERRQHDVCLLDYRLGDQDGLDLLRAAARRGCGTPVILLTAHGSDELDRRALDLGACGFLDKGRLDPRDLDRAVRYALRREGMVSELLNQNTELRLLHKLTRAILDGDGNYQQAAQETSISTGFPMVLLERYRSQDQTLVTLGTFGLGGRRGDSLPAAASPAAEVVKSRRPVIEMSLDPLVAPAGLWIRTFACLPMNVGPSLVGVLTLAHPEALPLDSNQVQRAATVAEHLGGLIARIDGELTGEDLVGGVGGAGGARAGRSATGSPDTDPARE